MARLACVYALSSLVGAASASAATSKAQLDPFGTNGVRIRISAPGQPISEPITGALLSDAPEARHGPATFDGPLSVTHGNLKVVVDPTSLLLTATRVSDGAVLLKQTNLTFVSATDADCNAPGCKKSPGRQTCACNDQLAGARPGSVQAKVTFQGTAGELVYGLGEHKTHKVQQAPYSKTFADSLYYGMSRGGDVSIPYYSSSLGYGFAWNLPSLGDVSITEQSIEWSSYATLGVDMWISATPAGSAPEENAEVDPHRSFYLDLLHQWVDVSGHPTPMPFWTTGFIQCKDRYRNQSQVLEVARGYVSRGLPISMIVIDWFHWKEMGDWQLNPECWPEPQAMVDELRGNTCFLLLLLLPPPLQRSASCSASAAIAGMGIELMITFWPFMVRNLPPVNPTAAAWVA